MKIALKTILGFLVIAAFTACEDDEATQPHAAMSVGKYIYDTNETMKIHFTGSAEHVVIYTGDTDHDYELREASNYGLVVNKGLFTYSYQQPGTYKVVCVATNHTDAGNSIKRDTCSFMVKVIDDVTEIERLSAPQVIYDEVFANPVNETDWLLRLPRKIKFKTSNATVSLSQKLKFYIGSDSTKVYIDDKEFSSTAKYNLANVLNIKLKSHEGTERPYKLYTVNYGEFKTFELLGVQGTITRSEFDYSYYEINMTVPSGSDLSNLAPTFTLYSDNDKVYIDDVEQISGTTTADFTKPVTYRFVASYPNRPDITAESTVIVTVTPQ